MGKDIACAVCGAEADFVKEGEKTRLPEHWSFSLDDLDKYTCSPACDVQLSKMCLERRRLC